VRGHQQPCKQLGRVSDPGRRADIQTRPIDVSEHWSTVLLKEWAVQASLETDLELPVSVIASADAALQAKGQIGFIKLFTQPLFDAVSDVLPGTSF